MSLTLNEAHKVLFTEEALAKRVKELADQINHDFANCELIAICVLKSSFIFFTDLIRHLQMPVHTEFLGVSSYGNQTHSSGEVKVTLDLNEPLEGKHVLVVEDIVDSGLTLSYLQSNLKARKPGTLKTCALLMKPEQVKIEVPVDYLGFEIGNEFVVGYGMDKAGKYRGLPYIASLE
jgi:hypoxanthine phosphoribosyltransferase